MEDIGEAEEKDNDPWGKVGGGKAGRKDVNSELYEYQAGREEEVRRL